MKSLVVYSSRTGNTRKIAQAIFDILPDPKEMMPVTQAPDTSTYDFIAMGFWVDKGLPDSQAKAFMKTIKGKTVGLFGTLGAYPDSDHARACVQKAMDLVSENEVAGTYMCQGKIDPAILETMKKTASGHHPMTPERVARIKDAESHPDQVDIENAQSAFLEMIRPVCRGNV